MKPEHPMRYHGAIVPETFAAGVAAWHAGAPRSANPERPSHTRRFGSWDDGWRSAATTQRKRSGAPTR